MSRRSPRAKSQVTIRPDIGRTRRGVLHITPESLYGLRAGGFPARRRASGDVKRRSCLGGPSDADGGGSCALGGYALRL
ncbi:hypothetical protein MARA_55590 [Mycolicibacterium arabiense]|uniref:Uncharacterized protein n=1 Tax=Mycolicibacterium arabiense TaxID=1286181 RepID=A0A7I7S6T7_9MYCO|nr:hypothetical protein MARA_55590 [Mycolicibacterium arabiense]